MRVLGVDPGTSSTGVGIVEEAGRAMRLVATDSVALSGEDFGKKLLALFDNVSHLVSSYHPDAVAVEEPFYARSAKAAIAVGQVRGVAILAAVRLGVPVASYSVLEVKQAVVGYGGATKDQVQDMVARLLGIEPKQLSEHVSDALAVAICHLHGAALKGAVTRAASRGVSAEAPG